MYIFRNVVHLWHSLKVSLIRCSITLCARAFIESKRKTYIFISYFINETNKDAQFIHKFTIHKLLRTTMNKSFYARALTHTLPSLINVLKMHRICNIVSVSTRLTMYVCMFSFEMGKYKSFNYDAVLPHHIAAQSSLILPLYLSLLSLSIYCDRF